MTRPLSIPTDGRPTVRRLGAVLLGIAGCALPGCGEDLANGTTKTTGDANQRAGAHFTRIAKYFLSPGLPFRGPVAKVSATKAGLAAQWRAWHLTDATGHSPPAIPRRRVVFLIWAGADYGGITIERIVWTRATATVFASSLPRGRCATPAVVGGELSVLAVAPPADRDGRHLRATVRVRERSDCG